MQVARRRVEPGHTRPPTTIFGEVSVKRLAHRAPGVANLHPSDAVLNLPPEKHSHGLRELAAIEASRGSFDEAAKAITRATGVRVGKRQVEELALLLRRRGRSPARSWPSTEGDGPVAEPARTGRLLTRSPGAGRAPTGSG